MPWLPSIWLREIVHEAGCCASGWSGAFARTCRALRRTHPRRAAGRYAEPRARTGVPVPFDHRAGDAAARDRKAVAKRARRPAADRARRAAPARPRAARVGHAAAGCRVACTGPLALAAEAVMNAPARVARAGRRRRRRRAARRLRTPGEQRHDLPGLRRRRIRVPVVVAIGHADAVVGRARPPSPPHGLRSKPSAKRPRCRRSTSSRRPRLADLQTGKRPPEIAVTQAQLAIHRAAARRRATRARRKPRRRRPVETAARRFAHVRANDRRAEARTETGRRRAPAGPRAAGRRAGRAGRRRAGGGRRGAMEARPEASPHPPPGACTTRCTASANGCRPATRSCRCCRRKT